MFFKPRWVHLCGADEDAEVDGVDEDGEVDGAEVLPPWNQPNIGWKICILNNQTHSSSCPVDKDEGRCNVSNMMFSADDDSGDGDEDFDPLLQDTLSDPFTGVNPGRCLSLYPLPASVAHEGF